MFGCFLALYLGLMTIFYISTVKKVILTVSFITQSFSYLFTILRNPGMPERKRFSLNPGATDGIRRFKTCRICKVIMNLDKKTYHCHFCCICVEGIFYNFILFIN